MAGKPMVSESRSMAAATEVGISHHGSSGLEPAKGIHFISNFGLPRAKRFPKTRLRSSRERYREKLGRRLVSLTEAERAKTHLRTTTPVSSRRRVTPTRRFGRHCARTKIAEGGHGLENGVAIDDLYSVVMRSGGYRPNQTMSISSPKVYEVLARSVAGIHRGGHCRHGDSYETDRATVCAVNPARSEHLSAGRFLATLAIPGRLSMSVDDARPCA
jgi:hypothetical protein